MYYAQIDEKGKVHTVCELADEMEDANLIQIEVFDNILLGSYFDPQTNIFQHIVISVDKVEIQADGIDTVIATAEVPAVLNEVTFYHIDTNEVLAIVPVDPETHTATIQIAATTPGIIRIRAGEPTITRLNEVTINAT